MGADAIARGAAATFLGYAGKLARPLALALFTRIYGLSALGTVLLVWAYVEIVSRLTGLGLDRGLQRWVPASTPEERPRLVATALVVSLVASLPVAVLVAAVLPAVLEMAGRDAVAVRLAALYLLPVITVAVTALHAVRGTRQIWALIWARSIVEPLGFLVGGLVLAPTGGGVLALLGAQALAITAVAAIAIAGLRRTFGLRALFAVRSSDGPLPWRALLRFSIPLGLADAVNLALQRVDVVAVGILTTPALTAAYAVAREAVTALSKIRQGFDQVLAPVAAELHAGSRQAELASAAAAAARWGLVVASPLALVFAVFPDAVLAILGVHEKAAATALAILSVGRLVDVATGPTAVLLGMVGWPRLVLLDVTAGLVVAVAGQAVLGPAFGLVGVAAATSIGVIVVNLLALYWLARLEGLHPVTTDLLRPAAAAAAAGIALVGLRVVLGAPALAPVAIGIAVWLVAYVALAIALGLLPAAWNPSIYFWAAPAPPRR